jgi:hypothetical protein
MTSHTDPTGAAPIAEAPVWDPANLDAGDEPAPAPAEPSVPKPAVPVLKPRRRQSGSTTVLLAISALIAVGGIGFAAGRALTPAATTTSNNGAPNGAQFPNGSFVPGDRGAFGGSATVSGTVVSVGSDSFTLKLANGQTVTIATGSSTTYHAQTPGSSGDLAAGQTVQVQTSGGRVEPGASASAGTTTARTATDVTITSK